MGWGKFSDDAFNDPQVQLMRATDDPVHGLAAWGVYSASVLEACRTRSDGFVPSSWVRLTPGASEVSELIVNAGLWNESAERDGWEIKNFLKYNPSRDEDDERREQIRAARSAAGKKSAARRQQNGNKTGTNEEQKGNPEPEPDPITTECVRARVSVNGKPVNDEAWDLTERILAEFNSQTGKSIGALTGVGSASESAKRIYLRVLEYPALGLDEHADIIARTLSSQWWGQDAPTVGVVYGPKVFEDNITRSGDVQGKPADLKAARDRKRLEALKRLVDGDDAA